MNSLSSPNFHPHWCAGFSAVLMKPYYVFGGGTISRRSMSMLAFSVVKARFSVSFITVKLRIAIW